MQIVYVSLFFLIVTAVAMNTRYMTPKGSKRPQQHYKQLSASCLHIKITKQKIKREQIALAAKSGVEPKIPYIPESKKCILRR